MRLSEIIMQKTDTGFGMTQYDNENFILAGGFRSGSSGAGTTRLKYMIYDRKIIAKTNDTEQAEVGVVELFVDDKTGTIEGLVNIEIYKKFRKSGYGSRIVRDIKDTAQGDLTIYDIQKKAKKFWDKMGVQYTGKSIKSGILSFNEDYDQIGLEAPKGEGSITGYVVDTGAEQLENYFVIEHGVPERVIENIRHEFNVVAVLRNFNVDEDYRGQGHGTELFEDFMVEAIESGAEAILLIADNGEELPFDLEEWYKGWGFDTIGQTSSGPFMVYRSAG